MERSRKVKSVALAAVMLAAGLAAAGPLPGEEWGPPVQLTIHPGRDWYTDWSPDGSRIAFTSNRLGSGPYHWDIWLMDADGGNKAFLTNHEWRDDRPSWDPNGDTIVFMRTHGWSTTIDNIWTVDVAIGEPSTNEILADGHDNQGPRYSPDGERIVFDRSLGGHWEIFTMDKTGGDLFQVTDFGSGYNQVTPDWSPDGQTVTFASMNGGGENGVWEVRPDGSDLRKVYDRGTYPRWSPDGTRILFESPSISGNWDIFVIDADGMNLVQVTTHDADDRLAEWSPDGKKIVFTSYRSGNWDIWVTVSASPEIGIDIKPGSCPNPLNVKSKGVLPVAILGTEYFDVVEIKTETILFEAVFPIRSAIQDVTRPVSGNNQTSPNVSLGGATAEVNITDTQAIGTEQPYRPVPRLEDPCECTTEGPDGFDDLTLKFETQEIVAALGEVNDRDTLELTLTAELMDGAEMEAWDCVIILKKGDSKRGGPPEGRIQLSRAKSTIPGVLTAEEFVVAGNVSGQIWYFPIVGGAIDPGYPIYEFSDAIVAGPAILDFDNDLDLDFVAMIQPTDLGGKPTGETDLFLFENTGPTFAISPIPDTLPMSGGFWFGLSDITAGDFWKDNHHDFVISISGDHTTKLYLFKQDSTDATFKQTFIADADWAAHAGRMDAGDAEKDDYQDFLIFDYPSTSNFSDEVYLYKGDGLGQFSPSFACSTIYSVNDIAVGDFNNDGYLDFVIGLDDDGNPGAAWLYLGDNSGTFVLTSSTPVFDLDPLHNSGSDHHTGQGYMDAHDIDKDGNLDVVACVLGADQPPYNATLWFVKGIGNGTFKQPIMIQEGIGGTSLATSISAPLKLQTTIVEEDTLTDRGMPAAFLLSQNYPNPVTKSSSIQYTLPRECHVTLEVYNAAGQKMITLVNEKQSPGRRTVTLDTKSLPDGIYFYRLETGDFRTSRKMMVLR